MEVTMDYNKPKKEDESAMILPLVMVAILGIALIFVGLKLAGIM
jgi:hypothetical protein